MKILIIGDVFSKSGRKAIANELPQLIKKEKIDFTIANVENCTHGRSINLRHYLYLKSLGVNFFTFGNHTWEQEQIYDILNQEDTVRPLNIKSDHVYSKYGVGSRVVKIKNRKIRITNLLGSSVNMKNIQSNPFLCLDQFLVDHKKELAKEIHIIDLHANATSEKNAFVCAYKNKVSAIVGTHTHVQTADERIVGKTAYITDIGMTGPHEGVIGTDPTTVLEMYRGQRVNFKLDPLEGKYQFCAVLLTFKSDSIYPNKIKRIYLVQK